MLTTQETDRNPLIAVSTWRRPITLPPYGTFDMEATGIEYVSGVQRAGGNAVLIPHTTPDQALKVLRPFDGLLMIGGDDVDPTLYGEEDIGQSARTNADSDRFESALLLTARELELPTLAVCRGMQVLNVAHNGTLKQDVAGTGTDHLAPAPDGTTLPVAFHQVKADPQSRLAEIYGTDFTVNSIHHQTAKRVGEGLRPVAYAPDGEIEGIEPSNCSWPLIGVQWHPEKMDSGQPLFDWLVKTSSSG